jgi:hypothetical protein
VNNNFDIFKNIANEELYAKTYITYSNLDDIKNKNFKAFSRFKFNGFIDILAKRLDMDFSELRDEANRFYDEIEPQSVVIEQQYNNNDGMNVDRKIALTIGAIVVVVALILVFLFNPNSDTHSEITPPIDQIPTEQTQIIQTEIIPPIETNETNLSETNQTSQLNNEKNITTQTSNIADGVKIIPNKYIWVGVINLETKEKKEYSGSNEIVLDKTKKQIVVVDGAYITIKVGDIENKYAQDGRVRFLVENGEIKEIRFAQFKELNNGKAW